MEIMFHENTGTFHLRNEMVSYIMTILPNGQLGQLYFGKSVQRVTGFDYLLEPAYRPMTSYLSEGDSSFSLGHVRQEYPAYGTGDYRHPAVGLRTQDGSRVLDLRYAGHEILEGKPSLPGLPAIYCESSREAMTLRVDLRDSLPGAKISLFYTIFSDSPALTRSVRITNEGESPFCVEQAMSLCLDLPDADYEWVQLSGAWARERHIRKRPLVQGIQSVESTYGSSSHEHSPFVILKRPETTETSGEAIGFSLIYSGNFLAQAQVDAWDVTRFLMGINPFHFSWELKTGESLQLPEALMVYGTNGLNALSQVFHRLYRTRLARGFWRDRIRPIVLNSWECLSFDVSTEKILDLARAAAPLGVEMLVLDDGWFEGRTSDRSGLGDWDREKKTLIGGLSGLSSSIEAMGMRFGLWIEPEMVNMNSAMFRDHPDWILRAPGRSMSHGRHEYVLDLSRQEVVDYLFRTLEELFRSAGISYVKWDMNRNMTEVYSSSLPPERQGEVMHRYILGVYQLYERLIRAFPEMLFESCASGGGRFDPGMLFYAPQCWISDDTDGLERIMIQYGSSLCYPVSSFATHVSVVPNQQVFRNTPFHTRANVAFFGTFGYEMDLSVLTETQKEMVRRQTALFGEYREVIAKGDFYRLVSPFDNRHFAAWMVVSPDRKTAVLGWYKILNEANGPFHRVRLQGLDEQMMYRVEQTDEAHLVHPLKRHLLNAPSGQTVTEDRFYGDELMNIGLITTDSAAGELRDGLVPGSDFDSRLYILHAE